MTWAKAAINNIRSHTAHASRGSFHSPVFKINGLLTGDQILNFKACTMQENSNEEASASNLNAQNEQSGVVVSFGQETPQLSTTSLTDLQMGRYHYLLSRYSKIDALRLVTMITAHGNNSWLLVWEKIIQVGNMNAEDQKYYNSIDSDISLGTLISVGDIIEIISCKRRLFKREPFLQDIVKNCVSDFLTRYIAIPQYSEVPEHLKEKPKLIGYIPTFNLNCQL